MIEKEKSFFWNISSMFKSNDDCLNFIDETINLDDSIKSLNKFKGKLTESPANIRDALCFYFEKLKQIDKVATYSRLAFDTNMQDPEVASLHQLCRNLHIKFLDGSAWLEPEILKIDDEKFSVYIAQEELKDYRHTLKQIYRKKPHILTEKEEKIIVKMSNASSNLYDAFSIFSDVEMSFDDAEDSNGESRPINQVSYCTYMKDHDEILRKNSFFSMYSGLQKFNLTLTSLLCNAIQQYSYISKIRNYDSSLSFSLFENDIQSSVYLNLIDVVNSNLSVLHKYLDFKRTSLKKDSIKVYDILAPIYHKKNLNISFEDSVDILINALHPLGEEYVSTLKKGIMEDGWIDVFPKVGKRSGAYSSGCYDSSPYILLNFNNTVYDLFVLAHEAGHSMHSYFSNKTQPYQYHSYNIFLAEIASTVNEILLSEYIMSNNTMDLKNDALQQYLDGFQSTLFRQTMFAEFELWLRNQLDNDTPITSEMLNNMYISILEKYLGKVVDIDEISQYEWSRIPHFYYGFYVYQYATGISIAQCIANKLINKEDGFVEKYLAFLKSGSSMSTEKTLKLVDIDIHNPQFIADAISIFDKKIDMTIESKTKNVFQIEAKI